MGTFLGKFVTVFESEIMLDMNKPVNCNSLSISNKRIRFLRVQTSCWKFPAKKEIKLILISLQLILIIKVNQTNE